MGFEKWSSLDHAVKAVSPTRFNVLTSIRGVGDIFNGTGQVLWSPSSNTHFIRRKAGI